MKYLLTLFVLVASQFSLLAQVPSTGASGSFLVGERDVSFNEPSLATPNVDARLWYPATSAGSNTPPANGQFPVIAFGHGFNLNYLDYQVLCSHLASWGYFVISPDVQNGFNVDHMEYARELAASIFYVQDEGARSSSDFFQKVDTMTGVLGHSMGGGASGLVPSVFPGINAISGLASAETNPSAITILGTFSGPYQVISGDADNTAPENTNQTPMYNAALGSKQWVSIAGGAHCKFTDGATICDLVSSPGSVTRNFQVYLARKYTTAFFNYFLKGDQDALPFLCGDSVQVDVSTGTLANQQNINCSTVGLLPPVAPSWTAYPNPCSQQLVLDTEASVDVFSLDGRAITIPITTSPGRTTLWVGNLPAGTYFIRSEGHTRTILVQR